MKIHMAPENVECSECNFKSSNKNNLKQHMKIHRRAKEKEEFKRLLQTRAKEKEEFERLLQMQSSYSDQLKDSHEKIAALKNELALAKKHNEDSERQFQAELIIVKKEHDAALITFNDQINGFETIESDLKNLLERKTMEYEMKLNDNNSATNKMTYELTNATKRLEKQIELLNNVRQEKKEAMIATNQKLQEATTKCSELQCRNEVLTKQNQDAEKKIKEQLHIIHDITIKYEQLNADLKERELKERENVELWQESKESNVIVINDSSDDDISDDDSHDDSNTAQLTTIESESTLRETQFTMQQRMNKRTYERTLKTIITEEWRTVCNEVKEFTMKLVEFKHMSETVFEFSVRVRLPSCP